MSATPRSEWLKNLDQESNNFLSKVKTITSNMEKEVERLEEMHELVRKHKTEIAPQLFNAKPNVNGLDTSVVKPIVNGIENLIAMAQKLAEYEKLVAQNFVNLSPQIQQDLKNQLEEAQQILEINKNH